MKNLCYVKCWYLPHTDFTDWGVDWEGPVAAPDPEGIVEVPEHPASELDVISRQLSEHIDPISASNCFGLNIVLDAIRLSETLTLA